METGVMETGVVRLVYAPDHDSQYPWLVEHRTPAGWEIVDWYPDRDDALSVIMEYVGD